MNNLNHNDIIRRLCECGYPTFLVGGAVRDFFDDKEPSDFDIATKATPEEIALVFHEYKVQQSVGTSFGVTLVDGIDVATFRKDRYPNGNGAKNCKVSYAKTIHEDLSRRDLTINALALCALSGDIIDNHEGVSDLKNRVIKFVGDPNERIIEDPNRIVRACRFVAKLQGEFDSDTLLALQKHASLVKTAVEPLRIAIEVKKAMELEFPSLFFAALHLIGALDYVFPGMSACVSHEHGKWHIETVWDHTMLAGDSVNKRFPVVRLAAFLHDVGKPVAFARHNDGTFVDHEQIGADIVFAWLTHLRFPHAERELIVGLIRSHMWGGGKEALSHKAIRKLRSRLHDLNVPVKDWLRLRIADRNANLLKSKFSISDIKSRATIVGLGFEVGPAPVLSTHGLALKGGALISMFNMKPGPAVSVLQKHLLSFVLENGYEFNTPELLAAEASRFLEFGTNI